MLNLQYNTNGKPLYVQVPVKEYEKLLADAEELGDITAYKKLKRKQGSQFPLTKHFVKLKLSVLSF